MFTEDALFALAREQLDSPVHTVANRFIALIYILNTNTL